VPAGPRLGKAQIVISARRIEGSDVSNEIRGLRPIVVAGPVPLDPVVVDQCNRFGKSVGTYTLRTNSQRSKGTFAYIVISWGNSRLPEGVHEVSFTGENGNIWTLAFKADGSFVDSSGVAWKRQTQG
jgi:hypothetical protein